MPLLPLLQLSLLLSLTTLFLSDAHVLLTYPTPRTNNDYLYTFREGACNPQTGVGCNAFCGDAYDLPDASTTVLSVNEPVPLTWRTNVAHPPYQYRFSLNPSAGDNNFDVPENIVVAGVDNRVAADASNGGGFTGSFHVNVTFPESILESCSADAGHDPCVLQLWDLYYFVSCANVLFTKNTPVPTTITQAPITVTLPPLPNRTENSIFIRAESFENYWVTEGLEETDTAMLDPILYLEPCQEYEFIIDAPGHPFVFKTVPEPGLDNLLDFNNASLHLIRGDVPTLPGIEYGSFTFTAGPNAAGLLFYYQCVPHQGMGAAIQILPDSNGTFCGGWNYYNETALTDFGFNNSVISITTTVDKTDEEAPEFPKSSGVATTSAARCGLCLVLLGLLAIL
ncbi:expressed unknown protein [Seminavis robusta]|uniref:Uncharacterized protein n=1 Tax=Seminavis robusta TaxID=568900 RepID=A0A9N8DLA4_9STRA|nr:expressed unknown protein [Seminavis robusta]|eukprot:Sro186_g080680.1 n/a (396) ;mRNA; r:51581-52768